MLAAVQSLLDLTSGYLFSLHAATPATFESTLLKRNTELQVEEAHQQLTTSAPTMQVEQAYQHRTVVWQREASAPAAIGATAPATTPAPTTSAAAAAAAGSAASASCAAWSCTCQGLSDGFGLHHQHSWGTADADARKWWMEHSCTTAPFGSETPPPHNDPLPPPPLAASLANVSFRRTTSRGAKCRGAAAPHPAPCIAGCAAGAAAPLPNSFHASAKPICKSFWHTRFDSASECRAAMKVAQGRVRAYLCAASGPCAALAPAEVTTTRAVPAAAQSRCETRGSRGFVTTGGLKTIWGSVGLHFDRFKSSLPVDIFVDNDWQLNACKVTLKEKKWDLARCHILDLSLSQLKARHPSILLPTTKHTETHAGNKKYELKLLAILQSCFDEVLFLDADAAPLTDLAPLFDTCEFKEAGALFWPDLWGHACSLHKWGKKIAMVGQSSWPDHIMWELLAPFGAKWEPRWAYGQEFESGQLVVDKKRHLIPLLVSLAFCTDPFIQKVIFGDKDAFKFAWLTVGHNYTLVRSLPSMFLRPQKDTEGGAILLEQPPTKGRLNRVFHFQSWGDSTPIIMHQMKADSYNGGKARVATHAMRTQPSPLGTESSESADHPDSYSYCPTGAAYDGYWYDALEKDKHRSHHPHLLESELLNSLSAWMAISH